MEQVDEGDDISDDQNQEEDTDLSMVLALLIGSGQLRLASSQHFLRRFAESDDESVDADDLPSDENLHEPDTIKDSALMQDVLQSSGKLKQSGSVLDHKIAGILRNREVGCCGMKRSGFLTAGCKAVICNDYLPLKVIKETILPEKLFCGVFSEDGDTFLSACQDGYLRVYKSSQFEKGSTSCSPFKVIPAIDVGWSILDVAFSPDALYAAYSTWSNHIHIASIHDNDDQNLSSHVALDLEPGSHSFAVFSLQFSGDNGEILCGANDGDLYIYDRNLQRRTSRIDAHEDDVNAIRFADKSSQILYSGGDDGLINVWDRRMLQENNSQKVGCFAGHLDGITFIDSKEDSRYLLSNSKDQTIKIWDMRKFSSVEAQNAVTRVVSRQAWDYRWQLVPRWQKRRKKTVPGDTSIKTYQGHVVTRTLIRARFSPLHSTGQRYIYCGSSDGRVVIYDIITGEIVSRSSEHQECVRDVTWHPYQPMIVSSSWDRHFKIWRQQVDDVLSRSDKTSRKRSRWDCIDDCDSLKNNTPHRRSPRLAARDSRQRH